MVCSLLLALLACGPDPVVDADGDGLTTDLDCDDDDDDAGAPALAYADGDGDGYVDPTHAEELCGPRDGWGSTDAEVDCDDDDASVGSGESWFVDADGDQYGNPDYSLRACNAPNGYAARGGDCDDGDAEIWPDAPEVCDGLDNDCDNAVDEDADDTTEWYLDRDGDGWGDGAAVVACDAPDGFVGADGDCDDADLDVNPDAEETCDDGVDQDCDGEVDEGSGCGGTTTTGEWLQLGHLVSDAEFDRVNGWIVTVSADAGALYVIDPVAGTVAEVALPVTPISVSVALDGGEAVVGHDGWVSIVDLVAFAVTDTLEISTTAADIVHGGNGWAYAFPAEDQWCDIHSLNLSTGAESDGSGWSIYEDTVAKLHPDGNRLYGATNNLSPSDFERYDITSGVASVDYDSPYHGDYAFSGDLWISDDGRRLFARSGNVFRASEDPDMDMTYGGALAGVGTVAWVDTSSTLDRVFAASETASSDVYVYDLAYLASQGTVTVPRLDGGSRAWDMTVLQVFVTGDGSAVHVLAELPASAGADLPYAVTTIDAAELP